MTRFNYCLILSDKKLRNLVTVSSNPIHINEHQVLYLCQYGSPHQLMTDKVMKMQRMTKKCMHTSNKEKTMLS